MFFGVGVATIFSIVVVLYGKEKECKRDLHVGEGSRWKKEK